MSIGVARILSWGALFSSTKLTLNLQISPPSKNTQKIDSSSVWGALGVLGGALTNFSCKLRLIFFTALGGAGAPTAPLATPMLPPPNLPTHQKMSPRKLTLALPGVHLVCWAGVHIQIFPVNYAYNFLSPPRGCRCTHCTPWLRLCKCPTRQFGDESFQAVGRGEFKSFNGL